MNRDDFPYTCDRCQKTIVSLLELFYVPLNREATRISGSYCSLDCARHDNKTVNRNGRTVMGWQQRDEWMLSLFGSQTIINNDNKLKKK